jgi:hypothetical protein
MDAFGTGMRRANSATHQKAELSFGQRSSRAQFRGIRKLKVSFEAWAGKSPSYGNANSLMRRNWSQGSRQQSELLSRVLRTSRVVEVIFEIFESSETEKEEGKQA